MPLTQESSENIFFESAHLQHPRHYHGFFQRSRPHRGELATKAGMFFYVLMVSDKRKREEEKDPFFLSLVSGFLLYPDAPVRLETTSREAFCFRPQQDRAKGHPNTQSSQHESLKAFPTSSRQTGKGNCRRDRHQDEQEDNHDHTTSPAVSSNQKTIEMESQYQRDYPAPSSSHRRQTPALPQQDNIGINPAFRMEFSTVQREAYQGWPIPKPSRHLNRLRPAPSRHYNKTPEY